MRPNLTVEHVRLSGLGSLAEYLREADRFVCFGD
jgi:sulfur relay (sulfurtransferase) complex TusBCD TusD component (DsrE family)